MTRFVEWLAIQRGQAAGLDVFDPTPRYLRSMRDMGQWVHVDALYQAYLCAYLILLGMKTRLDPGLPPVWWRKRTPLGPIASINRSAFGAEARGRAGVVAEGVCPGG